MFRILKTNGIPLMLLNAIKAMYSNTCAKVVTEDSISREFKITASVLRGDTLAPFLFAIVLGYALRKAIGGREMDLGLTLTQTAKIPQPSCQSNSMP